ncbi:MAG TPA: rhizopine-binding protein, partial [Pantoea sp.]|nr:rhizopine-binding protein [Pantoea sp.]
MNIKKTLAVTLLACMLPAAAMAKDLSVGVSMALFDDNFLTILRTAMQKEMQKEGVKGQLEDAKGDVSQQ